MGWGRDGGLGGAEHELWGGGVGQGEHWDAMGGGGGGWKVITGGTNYKKIT